jgi:signal peptidase I
MNSEKIVSEANKGFIYSGSSMNPLFKNSDLLQIKPYTNKKIQVGDVIVYCPPDEDKTVIHRVVSIGLDGIRTRGDNNWHIDDYTLKKTDIKGRVDFIQRRKRKIRVYGGRVGNWVSALFRFTLLIKRILIFLISPMYRFVAKRNFLRIKPKVLSYAKPTGTEFQILIGRMVIGRRHPVSKQWRIFPPFKLFIDESALP